MRRLIAVTLAGLSATVQAQVTYNVVREVQIGGAEEGPSLLQYVKAIDADARGNILILDRKTQDIRVFAPDGKYVKSIGRLGSGPGEFRDAEGLVIAPDGKIWVRDAANSRFSVFRADGTFETSWSQFFCTSQGPFDGRFDRSGRIVDLDCMVENGRGGRRALMTYHFGGAKVDTLGVPGECGDRALSQAGTWISTTMRDGKVVGQRFMSIPWAAGRLSTWSGDIDVYCVPNSAKYEILKSKLGGKDTLRITRSAPLVPVTAFEKDSVIKVIEEKGPTGNDFSRIPATKPAIEKITVDDRGRLWVRHTNAKKEIEFDIYAPDGRRLGSANFGVLKSSIYTPFTVRGDNVYMVVLDADDVQHVVRFRLTARNREPG